MTATYDVTSLRLSEIIDWVEEGRLGLPDFQRRFEWGTADVKALLSTVLCGLPSGTIIVARADEMVVSLRSLEGAAPLNSQPEWILLDGQQRITALYHAVHNLGPFRYGLDISALMDGQDLLQDNVVLAGPARRWANMLDDFKLSGRLVAPISALLSELHFFRWAEEEDLDGDVYSDVGQIFSRSIAVLSQYQIPVLRLGREFGLPALAQVFERLNKWGQALDSFDLLVARVQGSGWNLREAWAQLVDQHTETRELMGGNGLPAIAALALLHRNDVRRGSILEMPAPLIAERWDSLAVATKKSTELLYRRCGVAKPEYLPYQNILVATIATFLQSDGQLDGREMERYFWMSSAGRRYDAASNTKVVADVTVLASGRPIFNGADWVPTVEDLALCTRRSSSALWAAIICAMLARSPHDLATGSQIVDQDGYFSSFELVPISLGGGGEESSRAATRLRATGQSLVLSRSLARWNRSGFIASVRHAHEAPMLPGVGGATIADRLADQFFPHPESLLDGTMSAHDISVYRAERIHEFLSDWAVMDSKHEE